MASLMVALACCKWDPTLHREMATYKLLGLGSVVSVP